jgi:alcohol dehydrogenase
MGCARVPEIHEGEVVDQVGAIARAHGLRHVLLVTDKGVKALGHSERVRLSLEAAGLKVVEFDEVHANPTDVEVQACASRAKCGIDGFVAVGGGSSIDTAKGANFLLTNGGRMVDYWGYAKVHKPLIPLIAVPTTAGTGSEVQSYALIADVQTHAKMACGDPSAMPIATLLDARLTTTLPRDQTAYTGLDAIVHSVESAVCTARTDASYALSLEAFGLLARNLSMVLDEPDNLPARAAMLRGAMLAGRAIELSMLGGAHSAANPLTARFDIPHGLAVSLLLPHVIRFNQGEAHTGERYGQLAASVGAESLDDCIEELLQICGVGNLRSFGVATSAIQGLAAEAADQWTARFNPRALSSEAFEGLYRSALAEN